MLSTHIPDLSKATCKKEKNTCPELEAISKDTLLAMLMLKKFEIPVLTTREARNKLWCASLCFQSIIRELKWTQSDVQVKKTCPYLSLIGIVNAVLPFTEHMHRTTIT